MSVLYLAAPLFSNSELSFNLALQDRLSVHFDVYLPQDDGLLLDNLIDQGVDPNIAGNHVFKEDTNAIDKSDVVLAVLDGRTIDEGVCFEVGYAYAKGIPCYGFKSDPRKMLKCGNNPMIDHSLEEIYNSFEEVERWAANWSKDLNSCNKLN